MSQDGTNNFFQSSARQRSGDRFFRGGGARRRSPNITPASTVLNSPDLTTGTYMQHSHHGLPTHPHHQIKVGRSPVSQPDEADSGNSGNVSPDVEYAAATAAGVGRFVDDVSGELAASSSVVFDDIGDSWRKYPYDEAELASGRDSVIDYDESPRRFGAVESPTLSKMMQLTSPTFMVPRPGFPQRVTPVRRFPDAVVAEAAPATPFNEHKYIEPADIEAAGAKQGPFDYLYEFSETRKVLEDFFKSPDDDDDGDDAAAHIDFATDSECGFDRNADNSYIGQRLSTVEMAASAEFTESPARSQYTERRRRHHHPHNHRRQHGGYANHHDVELYLDSNSRSSGELADTELDVVPDRMETAARHYTLSPESMDYDSNFGDVDCNGPHINGGGSVGAADTVLEAVDVENDRDVSGGGGITTDYARLYTSMPVLEDGLSSGHASDTDNNNSNLSVLPIGAVMADPCVPQDRWDEQQQHTQTDKTEGDVEATLRDIRSTLQRTKTLLGTGDATIDDRDHISSPVWIPRDLNNEQGSVNSDAVPLQPISPYDEEADTDLETDRLLGQQRLDDLDDGKWCAGSSRPRTSATTLSGTPLAVPTQFSSATIRHGIGTALTPLSSPHAAAGIAVAVVASGGGVSAAASCGSGQIDGSSSASPTVAGDTALGSPLNAKDTSPTGRNKTNEKKELTRNKEGRWKPSVLIEGVLFRARYLGSTQLVCEGQPTKSTRMIQAEEAVSRIKAPDGETQPSTEVDLFISTEKIMVLNTDLKEIMMDHALRTISYIADIGDLVVLMARRRFIASTTTTTTTTTSAGESDETSGSGTAPKPNRTPKMICHVFESEEAQFIAQSIGQAFQVAYMEFLKANGIEDHSFVKEMDYQEVLNSQEIFGDELAIFAKKELQKEVVVPKVKGEILGVVIVESGWGSMLPTVVIANLLSTGAAARCGHLNIGDQIIAINGLSLVGLPLSTCQSYIRNTKTQTAVKFTVVPCPPVVEVKIKRPNTKYQLGFSVQNGVICSLLRGGIAERGGVRVGHRIIEINNQSVVAVPHEKIVSLLATSVGEILMKTMPTSMFRLLTGQENPLYI